MERKAIRPILRPLGVRASAGSGAMRQNDTTSLFDWQMAHWIANAVCTPTGLAPQKLWQTPCHCTWSIQTRAFISEATCSLAEAGNCPQNGAISDLVYLFQQRVALPQSVGEGPGMGLTVQWLLGDPASRQYKACPILIDSLPPSVNPLNPHIAMGGSLFRFASPRVF